MSDHSDPNKEAIEEAQDEFSRWATSLMEGQNRLAEIRLVLVSGMSRNGFRSALESALDEDKNWGKNRRSPYWTWVERRERLLPMDAETIVRLTDKFRKVGRKVGLEALDVSQSWWRYNGFGGLGVEVRDDGDDVEIIILSQGDDFLVDAVDADVTGDEPDDDDAGAVAERFHVPVADDGGLEGPTSADDAPSHGRATAEKDRKEVGQPIDFNVHSEVYGWTGHGRDAGLRSSRVVLVPDEREERLLRVRPGRVGITTLQSFENVLESMGDGHVYSLEIVSDGGATELLVRTTYPERMTQHIASHYPGCVIERVPAEEDPMVMREGETGYRHLLHPVGDEWLPFQVYGEQQVRDGGDPFIDILGGMMGVDLRKGERLVSRLVVQQQEHDWSEAWRARGMSGTGSENQKIAERERRRVVEEDNERRQREASNQRKAAAEAVNVDDWIVPIIILGVCAAIGWFLYQLWSEEKIFQFFAYGVSAVVGLIVVLLGLWKIGAFKGKPVEEDKYYDPEQVSVRISGSAFQFEVQTVAFLGAGGSNARNRAMQLLSTVNGVYRGFDNPLGCRFEVEPMRELRKSTGADMKLPKKRDKWDVVSEHLLGFAISDRRYGFFNKMPVMGVIGVKEIVAFWHIPGEGVEMPSLKRAQSKLLSAPPAVLDSGAFVGTCREFDGGLREIFFPMEVMSRHQLYVARTRQGKSTLMCHVASEKLAAKARGENPDSLVVVDPHSDLIHDVLERIPADLEGRVALLDLGGEDRKVGINLLDTRVFDDRDAAVEAVIEVAKGIWENWGNRMEIIMSYTLKAMYEANKKLKREGQLTMLDTAAMLTDDQFRLQVLAKVEDPFILGWWQNSHGGWSDDYGREAIAPVLTRMANYAGNQTMRSILGQRQCTLNVREVIERGDVLLVNTNQSTVGPEVASLVGASILKLVDTFVRKQGEVREDETIERRRVTLIVDEMQSIQGVDFQSMLSEVGKFGGSLILATQSLSRLDEIATTMRDSILSNIGVLVCFQISALDAKWLLPELRSEYLTEADITGLPQHNAYIRVATSGEVQPPFTMQVLPPFREDRVVEGVVVEGSYAYTRDGAEVDAELASVEERRVRGFRDEIEEEARGMTVDEDKVGEDEDIPPMLLEDLGKTDRKRRRRRKDEDEDEDEE